MENYCSKGMLAFKNADSNRRGNTCVYRLLSIQYSVLGHLQLPYKKKKCLAPETVMNAGILLYGVS